MTVCQTFEKERWTPQRAPARDSTQRFWTDRFNPGRPLWSRLYSEVSIRVAEVSRATPYSKGPFVLQSFLLSLFL